MQRRSIPRIPEGKYSRDRIRTLLQAVHVLEHGPASWEVQTLGERGASKRFETKMAAVDYALHLRPDSKVVVHYRAPRKVTFARIEAKAGQNPSLREQVIR
jgi:hypothetical protein